MAKQGADEIRDDLDDVRDEQEDIEAIDIDLDALDESLRKEHVGKPVAVKVNGLVVHIQHMNDWSAPAMRALNAGDWDAWAAEVVDDDDELEAFLKADLRNYQMEAIAREVARQGRMNRGKSRKHSGSSNTGRRR